MAFSTVLVWMGMMTTSCSVAGMPTPRKTPGPGTLRHLDLRLRRRELAQKLMQ